MSKGSKFSKIVGLSAAALVVVVGVVILLTRAGRDKKSQNPESRFSHVDRGPRDGVSLEEQARRQNEADQKVLSTPGASVPQVFAALLRLGQRQDPIARQSAMQRLNDKNDTVREAVAASLGYFDDSESETALSKLVKDPVPKVRIRAITALGMRRLPVREKKLEAIVAEPGLSPSEYIAAAMSLLKISNEGSTRERAIARMVEMAQSSKTPPAVAGNAAMSIISVAPNDPKVRALLRDFAAHPKNPDLAALSIRQLALMGDSEAKSLLPKLIDNANAHVRSAAVLSIPMLCPADRWTLVENILRSDRDRTVVDSGFQILRLMSPAEGRALLQRLVDSKALQGDEQKTAEAMMSELSRKPAGQDSCTNPKIDAKPAATKSASAK
jgi:hypothetical protein